MKFKESLYKDIVRVRVNKEIPGVYDVELGYLNELHSLSSLECHIAFYPYNRKINSNHFEFTPFEEYVNDIAAHQKSTYMKIKNRFCNIFGLFLGILIIVFFSVLKPSELLSIESIVSIIGAYFIGKELWDDIEELMINLSKNWRIRYVENYYFYRLERHTTLSLYSRLAKKRRYGREAILPEKMDLIQQKNSQTLRLFFIVKDLNPVKETYAHMMSIRMSPKLLQEFENDGCMFGVKLSFNKRFLGITRSWEFFQSIDKDVKGCLKENGEWINGAVFYRKTFMLGRIKFFIHTGLIENRSMVDYSIKATDFPGMNEYEKK
jgi:hypothetical protein